MPKKYSEEFWQTALEKANIIGVPNAAREMGCSAAAIRSRRREQGNPNLKKFSPEFKELAIRYASLYGTTKAAQMLGVSSDSVRTWARLKKTYGSASAKDPRDRSGKGALEEKTGDPEAKRETSEIIISSKCWALALYRAYVKVPDENGFEGFKEWLDKYVAIVLRERELESLTGKEAR